MKAYYARYFEYVKPVLKNKQVKTYTPLAFSLTVAILFGILVIRPTFEKIQVLHTEIEQQKKLLSELNTKNQQLETGIANLKKIDPTTMEKMDLLLPTSSKLPDLLNTLSTLAITNQAELSGIQIQPTVLVAAPKELSKNPQLQPIEFSFNVRAPFAQTVALLDSLKLSNRLLYVDIVSLNKPEESGLLVTVSGKAYILK
jgi:Tfp pilus assembly protein PilO